MKKTDTELPNHIGIILDGNRRWAKQHGFTTLEGHRRGAEVFRRVSLSAFDSGIKYLSAYIFSTENWQRSEEETSYLMKLIIKAVEKYLEDFDGRGIRIKILGSKEKLSKTVLEAISRTESKTKTNSKGTLAICLNYGGQQEILDATKQIVNSKIEAEAVTKEVFEQNLYSPEIPPVDLLIRTSGEQRISGFMLWRVAYAELLFEEKFWPDYTVEDLSRAIEVFNIRQRRFGS